MLTPTSQVQIDDGLYINQYFLHDNNVNNIALPPLRTKALKGITIHNTNRITANIESEQYTRATINGNMNDVRVHYFVCHKEIWQNMKHEYNNWSCYDGSGDGNTSTIAIEIIQGGVSSEEDKKALENGKKLVAYLLKNNKLTTEDLYTHTHWLNVKDGYSGTKDELNVKPNPYKTCPYFIIPYWTEFLEDINAILGVTLTVNNTLYKIQLGAFSVEANAKNYLEEVKKFYPNAYIQKYD